MSVFAVILDDAAAVEKVVKRLEDYHPIQIGSASCLVASEGALTSEIAEKAGIKGDNRDTVGIVLGLSGSRSGFHRSEVWEWVRRWVDQ